MWTSQPGWPCMDGISLSPLELSVTNVCFLSRWVGILRICKWTKYRLAACSALQWRVLNVIPLYSNFNNTTISLRQHAGLHRCDGTLSAQSFLSTHAILTFMKSENDWTVEWCHWPGQVRWMGGAIQFSCPNPQSEPPLPKDGIHMATIPNSEHNLPGLFWVIFNCAVRISGARGQRPIIVFSENSSKFGNTVVPKFLRGVPCILK